jgi:hypothetical protein
MKNTTLGFLPVEPAAADQTILSTCLEQDCGVAPNGVDKLTRATCVCLPAHKLTVNQSAYPPIERLARVLAMIQPHKLKQL